MSALAVCIVCWSIISLYPIGWMERMFVRTYIVDEYIANVSVRAFVRVCADWVCWCVSLRFGKSHACKHLAFKHSRRANRAQGVSIALTFTFEQNNRKNVRTNKNTQAHIQNCIRFATIEVHTLAQSVRVVWCDSRRIHLRIHQICEYEFENDYSVYRTFFICELRSVNHHKTVAIRTANLYEEYYTWIQTQHWCCCADNVTQPAMPVPEAKLWLL